jgi:hypothetical protein
MKQQGYRGNHAASSAYLCLELIGAFTLASRPLQGLPCLLGFAPRHHQLLCQLRRHVRGLCQQDGQERK